jgi:LacI family transcriptional regulator
VTATADGPGSPASRRPRSTERRVTLVDVAKAAGVDKAVVSRVVNDDPTLVIRPETRDRVKAAIDDLGYRPNLAARSLRTSRARSLGLVIPDFNNPVYAEIITGAETEAMKRGYVLMAGSSASVGGSSQRYLDLLGAGRVDALLVAGGSMTAADQEWLHRLGLPWLMLNNRTGRRGIARYVVLEDAKAARLAVDHLLGLGHTRIAHVAGPAKADTATRRQQGYLQRMRRAGLEVPPGFVASGDYTPAGGREAVDRLLDVATPPTAIFVANVASAIGVLDGLRESGLSVPHDVSVVAVHDLPLAAYLSPPLTTVSMPLRRLGARGVELLLSTEATDVVKERLSDHIDLVVRASTAPPRAQAG